MKIKKLRIRSCVVSFLFVLCCVSDTYAVVSTISVLKQAISIIAIAEGKGSQVLFVQVDNISKGDVQTQTYELSAERSYSIIAVGDNNRIRDIDLMVRDENDKIIGKDNDEENVAVVNVTPKWTGKFKFTVKAAKMPYPDGFYAIIVIRQDS